MITHMFRNSSVRTTACGKAINYDYDNKGTDTNYTYYQSLSVFFRHRKHPGSCIACKNTITDLEYLACVEL